jgi:hypothetical protein
MSDGTCEFPECERPGELIIDPYALEITDETVPVILCEDHEQEAIDAI